jgi:sec-independent protein translocase protein TatC
MDDDPDEGSTSGRMSFLEHLDELRKRIVNSAIAIAVCVVVGFAFINRIVDFILAPTRGALPAGVKMIYTEPGEAFSLYVQIALIMGVVLAAPFIMYQVWMFIAPGLYSNEKRMAYPFVFFTTVGFVLGAAFNHYIAFPFMMAFFASFNTPDLAFMPRLDDVFGLYTKMLLGMGIVFQMPTVVFFLAKMRMITAWFLLSNFKYAFLIIFVVAAVITPTGDMMTQTIFAAPMVALYILSILIAWVVGPKRLRAPKDTVS